MLSSQREAVLSLFEKHRQTPGADFAESCFLEYLIANPRQKQSVRNSFRGPRRFNAFIDEVQLTFGICFSGKDLDRAWTLDSFVERVVELQGSRRGSLASLKRHERAGAGWQAIVIADLLLLLVARGIRAYPVLSLAAVGLAVVVTSWFCRFAQANRKYLKELRARIEQ